MFYMGFLFLLAVIPGVILLNRVYKMDKVEREPKGLILKILLVSIFTTLAAIIIELIMEELVLSDLEEGTVWFHFVDNFICVALVEELCKYTAGRISTWKNKAFDYTFDAIVYMETAAVGFAVLENISYVLDGGISVGIMRAVLSVPGHVIFGLFMGFFYGRAKYAKVRGNRRGYKRNIRLAILVPTILHGFYDFCLSLESIFVLLIFIVYIVVVYTYAFKKQKTFAARDERIYPEPAFIPNTEDIP